MLRLRRFTVQLCNARNNLVTAIARSKSNVWLGVTSTLHRTKYREAFSAHPKKFLRFLYSDFLLSANFRSHEIMKEQRSACQPWEMSENLKNEFEKTRAFFSRASSTFPNSKWKLPTFFITSHWDKRWTARHCNPSRGKGTNCVANLARGVCKFTWNWGL